MGIGGKESEYSQTGKIEDAQVKHETEVQALEAELREAGNKLVKLEHEVQLHKVHLRNVQLELNESRECEKDLKQKLLKHSTVITLPNGMRDSQSSIRSQISVRSATGLTHHTPRTHVAISPHAVGPSKPPVINNKLTGFEL